MKKEYDLDKMKPRKAHLKVDTDASKTPVSIRIYGTIISWYKQEAKRLGIPYQTLMGSVLHRFATNELIDKSHNEKKSG